MIFYNDFFYVKDYKNEKFQYWRCQIRKCKGRLTTIPPNNIDPIEDFKLFVKCVTSLAFVPPNSVIKEFDKLQTK